MVCHPESALMASCWALRKSRCFVMILEFYMCHDSVCPCKAADDVALDYMLICWTCCNMCQPFQARFHQPWAASQDAPLVAGSMHSDRILVEQPHLRKLLKKFRGLIHDANAGIAKEEHQQLLCELCTHPLKPYLVRSCIVPESCLR